MIEGTVSEGDVMPEGPLGEFTGYYGRERSPQPVWITESDRLAHPKSTMRPSGPVQAAPSLRVPNIMKRVMRCHDFRSAREAIRSQQELAVRLRDRGFEATQATVSRDQLDEVYRTLTTHPMVKVVL